MPPARRLCLGPSRTHAIAAFRALVPNTGRGQGYLALRHDLTLIEMNMNDDGKVDPRDTPEGRRNLRRLYLWMSVALLYLLAGAGVGLHFNPTFFGALVGLCVAGLPPAIIWPIYFIIKGMRGGKI